MQKPLLSRTLVAIQFGAILLLLLTGPWFAHSLWGLALQGLGVAVGLWGVLTMQRFNIVPDPRPDCELVCHGPYRWIRHPMYLSIILFFSPPVVETPTTLRLGVFAILIADLLIKLSYEERLLCTQVDGYSDYCRRSKRLLPFIW
ncbi:Protein-S-isoprenylcysteine O-methyltransferase Ste14 [Sulfurivirga caldicuralii]|uniref:Protein-S-isoprenylcysteine O-methyltransferase Ste14 n=1 Tax=Sulfurivirga caldicuralii TaxID=364032 RepID=A0A1N6EVF1_9GAMM|nr:isoprenylcysteine carboxylmethyltransferase family protein [Sulfurivirga caldicuralii]SIN86903.1 Protein-S-isoprenylcysteine O-methyltransferase Ste14 [Sulfurivirga caldicuralii]